MFYGRTNDFEFKELPELLLQHEGLAEKNNILFSGDPNKVIVNLEGDAEGGEEQPPEGEGEEGEKKPKEEE